MSDVPILQQVAQALRLRGYNYVHSDVGYAFEGKASICGHPVRMRVTLTDDTLVDLPIVQMLDKPPGMPSVVPHLSHEGNICYAGRGTVALDIFDPAGQVLACIERAIDVAQRAIKGEMQNDFADEFYAYWHSDIVLADTPLAKAGSAKLMATKDMDSKHGFWVLTDDPERSTNKLSNSIFPVDSETADIRVFVTGKAPAIRQSDWPPKTVGQFLTWQGGLDIQCVKDIRRWLISRMSSRYLATIILIQSPTFWYGCLIRFDHNSMLGKWQKRKNPIAALLNSPITPLSVIRIDDEFLASRNTPDMKTLTGLRIALVGCGTIGGFLADLMVRAGAGLNGGELALIDSGYLEPGNVGRHRLGLSSIYKPKVTALAADLRLAVPSVNVTPFHSDVRKVAHLEDYDLVIDATGEEALSNHLNLTLQGDRFVPMVFVWIAGTGESVNVLIRDTKDCGCMQCLKLQQKASGIESPVANFMMAGCVGLYVPFPASVSISAAALAMDAIMDWNNVNASPRYRVRKLKRPEVYDECDIDKHQECPACTS